MSLANRDSQILDVIKQCGRLIRSVMRAGRASGISSGEAFASRIAMTNKSQIIRFKQHLLIPIVCTLAYWYWESKAEGNIRVDLIVVYPVLFTAYVVSLWGKLRFWSVLVAALLMILNFTFFAFSYDLFDKHPG